MVCNRFLVACTGLLCLVGCPNFSYAFVSRKDTPLENAYMYGQFSRALVYDDQNDGLLLLEEDNEGIGAFGIMPIEGRHHVWGNGDILLYSLLNCKGIGREIRDISEVPFIMPLKLGIPHIGVGYRYFVTGDHPYEDWFIGVYGYGGNKRRLHEITKQVVTEETQASHNKEEENVTETLCNQRFHWNIGIELVTAYWQATLNGYSSFPWAEQKIANYRQEKGGVGGRLSTYYWQKMSPLGRMNPFLFGAMTKVATVQAKEILRSQWVKNGGIGVRWEYDYARLSVAIEFKAIWDDVLWDRVKNRGFLGANYHIRLQLASRTLRNLAVNDVKHRGQVMPERYSLSYYQCNEPRSKQPGTQKKTPGQSEEVETLKREKLDSLGRASTSGSPLGRFHDPFDDHSSLLLGRHFECMGPGSNKRNDNFTSTASPIPIKKDKETAPAPTVKLPSISLPSNTSGISHQIVDNMLKGPLRPPEFF